MTRSMLKMAGLVWMLRAAGALARRAERFPSMCAGTDLARLFVVGGPDAFDK